MMHCTMDDLLALRAGEASAWARGHLAECAACRSELEALYQRVARLKALPALAPARDRWPAVRDARRAERRGQRVRRVGTLAGLAAAAVLAGIVVLRPDASTLHAGELAEIKGRSAMLETRLQELDTDAGVMSGRVATLAAELEDRIAVIDGQLVRVGGGAAGAAGAAARGDALVELWRERVDLMQQLVTVRVTRAAYMGL